MGGFENIPLRLKMKSVWLVVLWFAGFCCASCVYTDYNTGYSWDLSPLTYDSNAGTYPPGYSFTSGSNTFYINFCAPVSSLAIGDTGHKCASAGSCQESDQYYSAGQAGGYTFDAYYPSGTNSTPGGVVLTYSNGNVCQSINEGRISHIFVVCPTNGQQENAIYSIEEESTCNYDIYFSSRLGCVNNLGSNLFSTPFTTTGYRGRDSFIWAGNMTLDLENNTLSAFGSYTDPEESKELNMLLLGNVQAFFYGELYCTPLVAFFKLAARPWLKVGSTTYTTRVYNPGTFVAVDVYRTSDTQSAPTNLVYLESTTHYLVWASMGGLLQLDSQDFESGTLNYQTEFDYRAVSENANPSVFHVPSVCFI